MQDLHTSVREELSPVPVIVPCHENEKLEEALYMCVCVRVRVCVHLCLFFPVLGKADTSL